MLTRNACKSHTQIIQSSTIFEHSSNNHTRGYSYNEMLYSNENKSTTAMCENIDEPHNQTEGWHNKKPVTTDWAG